MTEAEDGLNGSAAAASSFSRLLVERILQRGTAKLSAGGGLPIKLGTQQRGALIRAAGYKHLPGRQ
jgi:hypothetical protein